MNSKNTAPARFALAGKIVSDYRVARRIWREAIRDRKTWLIPQARNVYIKLRRSQEGNGHEAAAKF